MKYLFSLNFCLMFLFFANTATAQNTKTDSTKTTKTTKVNPATVIKEFSYSYGYSFAKDLKEKTSFKANELDEKEILKGLQASIKVDTAKLRQTNEYLDKRLNSTDTVFSDADGKKTAYNLGYNAIGNMVSLLELPASDFNFGSIKAGYTDYTKGKKPKLSLDVMEQKLSTYFQAKQIAAQEKQIAKRKAEGAKNLETGNKFLAENAKKENIKTTASGLQYQVIKEGSGEKPTLKSIVVAHYTGTFIDGKVFDSSIERGQPASFPLGNVIVGWQEALQLMSVGSRYKIFLPASLAYGEEGPASIPANSVLIFDVELLEIQKEDPNDSNEKSRLSYAYGFLIGRSLGKTNFNEKEKDVNFFIQGFAKGFEASPEDMASVETILRARMEKGEPVSDEMAAKKIAFAIGLSSSSGIATDLGAAMLDFDVNAMGVGYTAALEGKTSLLTDEEMNGVLQAYFGPKQMAAQEQMAAKEEAQASVNITAGEAFLKENATKPGVVTMPNGMQYIVMKQGEGAKPTLESKVTTHYHGTLINGTVFDSSVNRGEPATFPLNGVIQGWQDGLVLMSVGSKYKFFIPSSLAYGNQSMGNTIPAGSLLIFEVELISVE